MNNKKKKILIASLLGMVVCLGIGFAAFSTTLKINGSAKVSPDGENYKVFFVSDVRSTTDYDIEPVDAISTPDNIEYEKGIISEETNFTNTSVTFTEDGQSIDYKFYILNAGKYDAHFINLDIGKKTCTPGEDADPALAASACSSINLSVILGDEGNQTTYTSSQAISDHILPKGTWEQIIVRITYPEGSPLVDGDLEVNWQDINIITATNPSYVPPIPESPVKILSGDIDTIGSEISIGEEHFYVIPNRDETDTENVSLFAKYNLLVGKDYEGMGDTLTREYTEEDEGYGLQSPQAIGAIIDLETEEIFTGFTNTVPYTNSDHPIFDNVSYYYNNELPIYEYVNSYSEYIKHILEEDNIYGDLLSYEQAINLGCTEEMFEEETPNLKCDNSPYSFLISTTYWSSSSFSNYQYIMLTEPVWNYGYHFGYGSLDSSADFIAGVRPVIIIPKSYFE